MAVAGTAASKNVPEAASVSVTGSAENATKLNAIAAGKLSGRVDRTDLVAAERIASNFESLAGSRENALSLVGGLRKSAPISLKADSETTSSGSLTFTPPTKPMAYGEINQALSLTQAQLSAEGIVKPTPQHLKVALMGGTITSGTGSSAQTMGTSGVLELRSQGMGWGKIAQTLNVSTSNRLVPDTYAAVPQMIAGADVALGHGSGAVNAEDSVIDGHNQVDTAIRVGQRTRVRMIGNPEGNTDVGGQAGY